MRPLLTLLLCLLLPLSAAAVERSVTVTPLTEPPVALGQEAPAGVCLLGNQPPANLAINDWIWGQESYATVFSADQAACSACPYGFTVEQVHIYMNFRTGDAPSTFNVSVDFLETVVDPASGCAVPGPVICSSPVYQVSIPAAGLYDIALPVPACDCSFFGYDYAVAVNFPNAFPSTMRPDAVTDNVPVGCVSFNDFGSGWQDTFSFGFPGELILYADIVCCESPVGEQETPWGRWKALYR